MSADSVKSESPTFYVRRRVGRFFDESLDDEARFASAVELAKFASGWLKEATAPLPVERFAEAEAISTAVDLLINHCDTHFTPSSIGPFQARWLELVEADRAAGGEFGEQMVWRELLKRLRFLAVQGRFTEALELADREGPHSIRSAPSKWRVLLLCMRADCLRLRGHFERALADLQLADSANLGADVEQELQVAGVRFSVETNLGRLDRAEAALSVATSIVEELGDEAAPVIQSRLWRMRIAHLLSLGHGREAVATARTQIEQLSTVLAETTDGLGELDRLRYQAFLAAKACGWAELQPEDRAFASIEAANHLAQHSYLDQYRKSAVAIDSLALLHARGRTQEAREGLLTLDLNGATNGSSHDTATSESPLLALRLAALRFEVTESLSASKALAPARHELHRAYRELLEVWRDVALEPSGVGFLEFNGRRRALHTVLESVLASKNGTATEALSFVLAADSCSTIARRLNANLVSAEDLVELTRDSGASLVYLVPTPEVTHRFLVSTHGVEHERLEGEAEFIERFRPLLRELRRRPSVGNSWPSRAIQPQLEWLSRRLVPASTERKIWYAGLGAFGFAPVEVLAGTSGQPIGLTHIVARVSSVNALSTWRAVDRARPAADTDSMSLFTVTGTGVDPTSGQAIAPIPFGIPEYAALRSSVPRAMVSYVNGPEGTSQGFLDALNRGPDVFIAMAHGTSGNSSAGSPGLLVRSDATVDGNGAPELTVLTTESMASSLQHSTGKYPTVAILAACGAGAGPRRLGDAGAGDFSGILLTAGIPAVLIASEEVEVDATIAYIQAFSSAFIRDRKNVGQATRLARLKVAGRPDQAHPHFWASLQLHGWSDAKLK